ncbi:MAG TPA: class I SAM-dependent methyltransferase [Candidatus Saccharimonadia bacterium]|nr:class I SAM-dependent methyltransferase [Candidatus Saccharimonadia bacterium]
MKELFSLGNLYVSDFIRNDESPRGERTEMKLLMTDDGNVRLEKSAPLDTMYGKYWYRSGINNSMKQELKNIVDSILKIKQLKENDIWLDIACNDGTLFTFLPQEIIKIGIDPVDDSFKKESEKHADIVVQDYFSAQAFKSTKYGHLKAKVITSIAMFYDLEHPESFIKDVHEVLDDNGLWVLQLSYTPLMLKQLAFDNICHEHIYYYSLFNLKRLFAKNGFQIVDCQLNDTNGGSFRVYAMKQGADIKTFATQPHRDVCKFRVDSLLVYEAGLGLDSVSTWHNFYDRISQLKEQTVSFIQQAKADGKKVWGYGASTKGNTLLQYFGLDSTLIDGIAERSVYKFGLKTVGTNIPIYSEDEMRKAKPDYLLVLPWHFINEFVEREKDFLSGGGKFIVPCPKFEIIGL